MSTKNTLVTWRRYVLSTAAVVAISGTGYLAFHGSGDPRLAPVQQAVSANKDGSQEGAALQSGPTPNAGDQTAQVAPLELCDGEIKFSALSVGGIVRFGSKDSKPGKINLVQNNLGITQVAGELEGGEAFAFAFDHNHIEGMVVRGGAVWVLDAPLIGPVKWTVRPLGAVACRELPPVEGGGAAATATTSTRAQAPVPVLNGKPGAKVTVLLSFEGNTVTDPLWNGGKTFEAKPAGYSLDEVMTVVNVVSERFAAFDINVTTDPLAYAKASVGKRMRVILTTTNVVRGFGGYAWINSLNMAGSGVCSSTVPCFVFTNCTGTAKNAAECVAHEVGHTFGLHHSGVVGGPEYYLGQGDWAPIMGTAYTRPVAQWSKGEYNKANNREDDLSVISNAAGYRTVSNNTTPTRVSVGTTVSDVVSNEQVARYFNIAVVKAGSLTASVSVPAYGALNAALEIYSGSASLGKANDPAALTANLTVAAKPGVYTVKVYGEGNLNPATNGYSAYGSVGSFNLTTTVK